MWCRNFAYPNWSTTQGLLSFLTSTRESVNWVMNLKAKDHNLLLKTMGDEMGSGGFLLPSSDQVSTGVAHVPKKVAPTLKVSKSDYMFCILTYKFHFQCLNCWHLFSIWRIPFRPKNFRFYQSRKWGSLMKLLSYPICTPRVTNQPIIPSRFRIMSITGNWNVCKNVFH